MKKRLLSILLMCCMVLTLLPTAVFAEGETDVSINETNFPDANFRTVVKEYDTDKDENLSRAEIEAVKEIKCYYRDIRSLTGIEYFTALQTLECYSNQLTSLDISGNTALKSLDCAKNQLAALDVSQNTALESLDCADNQLTTLDVSRNTALKSLDCAKNQLTTLDVSRNTALESLNCADNQVTSLDISQNTALESLICAGNKLTALNVSGNATLKFLNCESNELTALDVNRNTALNTLNCLNNRLTSLNVSLNLNLQDLNCAKNKLAALDVQKNTALKSLYCGYNQLTVLDVGQNRSLESLSCNNNLLTSLNVSQNTRLNLLLCFNNHLTSLDTSNQKWLHTLSCNNNNYPITITNDRNYDLSDLPGTFDVNKASNWSGGTVSGNILTVDHDKDGVTYTYDCGNGRTANFTLTVENKVEEQFTLTPGGRYYFDLSAMNIPGTVNGDLPDGTLHYVPFTYVGTVNAYSLENEADKDTASYEHSLFIANYNVTHTVSWNGLNAKGLIFGKNYASGGVDYTLRAPSVGSNSTGSADSQRGVPQSNEWDTMLNKNSGYIQNWNGMYSWGQDAFSGGASYRAVRGCDSARYWVSINAAYSYLDVGFRPVLEVLNADTLGSGGLKVVTLDLGGGTLGNSSEDIQIIVKTGSEFTAPASGGLTRPNGDTGSYFMWLGSDGKLYAPSANVPAEVTKLTAQFALSEQFSLKPGGTYYFDLSAMGIPGTVNDALPDNTLHYVPFTYAGTVNAYKLTTERATTEEYAQREKYPHSLFIADYNVTFNVDWNQLNEKQMIFGTPYTSYGVNYTMRAPSAGSQSNNGKDDSSTRGIPKSNEWDAILDKANQDWKDNISGYIKNWSGKYSFGQDNYAASYRAYRGYFSARFWGWSLASTRHPDLGFRPVLEVLNPDTLDSDGLKVVTLDLGGGKLGGSSDAIHIIVKTGSKFTAPASDGMTRPDGNTGSFFMWLGSDGKLYAPGAIVPAEVTKLTVQWTAPTYAVTLNTNGGTINNGNVTEYTYGVGATLPTADDMTYTGHTFKGWYDNESLIGSPVTAIGDTETGNKEYWAKWEINQYTVTVKPENGKADITITQDYGTPITAPTLTREGYQFNGWDKTFPTTMPAENLTITAQWRYNGGGGSGYSYYTIKATAGAGGSISPSGNVSVREGRDQTFTITPDKGYAVANVKIDGKSIGAVKSYTFENVSRTHTIEVIFMKANGNPQTGVFVDVATGSYYEDAVDWAVENGITKGTDDTHFSPDGICTRAQAVTFLWRAAGSPEPKTNTMPFTDVNAGSYYYDAVLWAVENGITKGTSDTTFSPNMTCTRAQIVAFLWRSEKSPAAGTANPFADVKSTAYYADAVLWAVREDITKGTTNTTFSPDADCTRAQIVTFLWRCKK